MPVLPIASAAVLGLVSATAGEASPRQDPFYCAERSLGRYFYCASPLEEELPPAEAETTVTASPSATAEVEAIRTQLEELRAEAVLRPTPESVASYIRFQREQLDRASTFSDMWRRALWMDPSLDYNLERPASGFAKRAWLDGRKDERQQALAGLKDRYGLFYFYAASCSACQTFSPVLRGLADAHDLTVKAVSTDGGPSAAFPAWVRDSGQKERLGFADAPVPAVILFDSETKEVTPVAFGVTSQAELEERLFILTQKEPGADY
jgi:conjugal transfer pilus assembly protein TraF